MSQMSTGSVSAMWKEGPRKSASQARRPPELRLAKVAVFYIALIVAALIWLTPVVTLVLTALKDAGDFAVNGAFSIPKSIRWANFSEAWQTGVGNYFWNSVIVTAIRCRSVS